MKLFHVNLVKGLAATPAVEVRAGEEWERRAWGLRRLAGSSAAALSEARNARRPAATKPSP